MSIKLIILNTNKFNTNTNTNTNNKSIIEFLNRDCLLSIITVKINQFPWCT